MLAAPSNLTAVAGSKSISINWKDNNSGTNQEAGTRIYRTTDPNNWPTTPFSSVPKNSTSAYDPTVTAGKTYWYRLKAYQGTTLSPFSNVASAKVGAAPPPPPPPPPPPTGEVTITGTGASIVLQSLTATAGVPVHVRFVLPADPHKLRFTFDFGDTAGKYNIVSAFNAAHVYETAGTFTLKGSITNPDTGAAVGGVQTTITVKASTITPKVCTTAAQLIDALAVLADNQIINATGVKIQRSTTFDFGARSNVQLIGPEIEWTGPAQGVVFNTADASHHNVLRDVKFSGVPAFAITPHGSDHAIIGCTFASVQDAINCAGNPKRLLIQDCKDTSATSIIGYFLWLQGTDIVLLGNRIQNSTRMHIVRGYNWTRVCAYGNDFANISQATPGDTADYANTIFWPMWGTYFYAAANKLGHGKVWLGPNWGASDTVASQRASYTVFERNQLTCPVTVRDGSAHYAIRDNATTLNFNAAAYIIQGWNSQAQRASDDIAIEHNSVLVPPDAVGPKDSNGQHGPAGMLFSIGDRQVSTDVGTALGLTNVTVRYNLFVGNKLDSYNAQTCLGAVYSDSLARLKFYGNVGSLPSTFAARFVNVGRQFWQSYYKSLAQWNAYPEVEPNDQLLAVADGVQSAGGAGKRD